MEFSNNKCMGDKNLLSKCFSRGQSSSQYWNIPISITSCGKHESCNIEAWLHWLIAHISATVQLAAPKPPVHLGQMLKKGGEFAVGGCMHLLLSWALIGAKPASDGAARRAQIFSSSRLGTCTDTLIWLDKRTWTVPELDWSGAAGFGTR